MEDQGLKYNDFQMFLGISAGIAVGAIAGTLITTSVIQQEAKNKRIANPEDLRKYFSFLSRASKLVVKDIPEIFREINDDRQYRKTPLAHQNVEDEKL